MIRTIQDEEIDLAEYRHVTEALTQIGPFIEAVYRTKRMQSALGSRTPAEFEAAWHRDHQA